MSGFPFPVSGAVIAFCGLLGLAVGSFLNVVIYRVPRKQSIVSPRSACPSCSAPIRERDNIPVLSWLLLRGRCRDCGAPISPQYPLVELLTAGLFVWTAARFGASWELPAYLVLFAGLVPLAVIDAELMVLPTRIVSPVTAAVSALLLMASAGTGHWHQLVVGLACAAAWCAVFLALYLISPRFLGLGDVRLAPLLGISLGWLGVGYAVLGFFAANLIGAVIGLVLIAVKGYTRQDRVAYGVFLAAGCAVGVLLGPHLLEPFSHFTW